MTINEKIAYIKGMLEGMELDTKEAKLITAMLDVLDEIGLALEDADASFDAIDEELNAINDELDEIEEILDDEDEYDDEDEDEDEDESDPFWDDLEDDFAECDCPNCGEYLFIDRSAIEAGCITCPNCDVKFAIEVNDECGHGHDGCDCDCCDHDHEEE